MVITNKVQLNHEKEGILKEKIQDGREKEFVEFTANLPRLDAKENNKIDENEVK